MSRPNPNSKAAVIRRAEATLMRLLRSPKSRAGLIAAVSHKHTGRNFVYGWLTDKTRTGVVVKLKSGSEVLYQLSKYVVAEKPALSDYPEWLDPRSVPAATVGRVYVDGRPAGSQPKDEEE